MIWIKLLKKLFKALNADASPSEIAGGVVLGAVLGLTPVFALHNLLILALVLVIRVNVSAAVFSSILFGIIGYTVDPVSHALGSRLLTAPALSPLWEKLYNVPVVPLSMFNNTVVLGSLVISVLAALPLFFVSAKFVIVYRSKLQAKIEKMKLVKLLKASKIYGIYKRFKS